MNDDDRAIAEVYRKIEREKALIHAASNMRQSTNNPTVQARVDSNIRDGRRNITYLEEKMRDLQMRHLGRSNDNGPTPPAHGQFNAARGARGMGPGPGPGPTPPPKDTRGYMPGRGGPEDYGEAGPARYSQSGTGMMPSMAPYRDPRPSAPMPKARPNFSKLGITAQTRGHGQRADRSQTSSKTIHHTWGLKSNSCSRS